VENILLGPIRDDLLKPDRVARMVKEMQVYFSERMQATRLAQQRHPASWKNQMRVSRDSATA